MLIAAAMIALLAPPSGGPSIGFLTAGSLRDRCRSSAATDITYCFAYVTGVYDAVKAYETWLNIREFCPAAGVPQGDLRSAFVDYLASNPGYIAGEAASVVVLALKHRFPCGPAAAPDPKASAPPPQRR